MVQDVETQQSLLPAVKWDGQGLVCAVVQDVHSRRVLMVAWMDKAALERTLETGFACYYSRSRQKPWMKGESSGHTQKVAEIRLDCDGDAVLLLVEQAGGIACHTGRESCFYRKAENVAWQVCDTVLKSPDEIYAYEAETGNSEQAE